MHMMFYSNKALKLKVVRLCRMAVASDTPVNNKINDIDTYIIQNIGNT